MPFEKLETVQKTVAGPRVSISYRRLFFKTNRSKRPRLVLGLSPHVATEMKIKAGTQFAILLGTGADEGKARIIVSPGGATSRLLKHSCSINFGFVPMLGEDAAEKEYIDFRVVKEKNSVELEIKLPAWFKAN